MHAERLTKLAEFLDKLPDELFNFGNITSFGCSATADSIFVRMKAAYEVGHNCGTSGCAIGWCPIIWPEQWEYKDGGLVKFTQANSGERNFYQGARLFFELMTNEVDSLFLPWCGDLDAIPEGKLPNTATAKDVAAHIRHFIQSKSGVACQKSARNLAKYHARKLCT